MHLIGLSFAHSAQAGQQFGNVGRREKLDAAFARIAGVHGHQVFPVPALFSRQAFFYILPNDLYMEESISVSR